VFLSPFGPLRQRLRGEQRGIKGDFKIMLRKSPLAPLFPPGQRPYGPEAKEGYKGTFVLLEPITEGLRQGTGLQ